MTQQHNDETPIEFVVRIDPCLVRAIDAYVAAQPTTNRDRIIGEALALRILREQERELEAQLSASTGEAERQERAEWRRIRRSAAVRTFGQGGVRLAQTP